MSERISGLNEVLPAALVNGFFVMNNNGAAAPGLQDTCRVSYAGLLASPLAIGGTAAAAVTGTVVTATSRFLAADGTAALPGIGFSADLDTGFYRGAANAIYVSVNGAYAAAFTTSQFSLEGNKQLDWNADTKLFRDAANIVAQRNGTTAQEFRVYNTFTDASNYERGAMRWNSNVLEIGSFNAGTGAARSLAFMYGSAQKIQMSSLSFVPVANGLMRLGSPSVGWSAFYVDYTNTATVGAVVINKAAGRVNIAAAGIAVVVTNSLVTAASHVFAVVSQNDATAQVMNVVPAAGSFTINLTAAATAQTSIDFFVVSAD